MATLHDADILRPLQHDEIEKIIALCAEDLPISARGYNFLRMHMKLKKLCKEYPGEYEKMVVSDYMKREIYTKWNGIIENCTFISISRGVNYSVFIYSKSNEELHQCLMETNLIDYSFSPVFISVEGWQRPILLQVFASKNVNIVDEQWCTSRILPKAVAHKFEYELPDDIIEQNLSVEDADVVNEAWPHHYSGSLDFVKTLIAVNDSVGIFDKDTRELRAWGLLNDQFGLGMVHTLPVCRKNGYAKIVIKSLSKKIAHKHDIDIQIFVVKGNTLAEHLFDILGFIIIPMPGDYSWIFTRQQLVSNIP